MKKKTKKMRQLELSKAMVEYGEQTELINGGADFREIDWKRRRRLNSMLAEEFLPFIHALASVGMLSATIFDKTDQDSNFMTIQIMGCYKNGGLNLFGEEVVASSMPMPKEIKECFKKRYSIIAKKTKKKGK